MGVNKLICGETHSRRPSAALLQTLLREEKRRQCVGFDSQTQVSLFNLDVNFLLMMKLNKSSRFLSFKFNRFVWEFKLGQLSFQNIWDFNLVTECEIKYIFY